MPLIAFDDTRCLGAVEPTPRWNIVHGRVVMLTSVHDAPGETSGLQFLLDGGEGATTGAIFMKLRFAPGTRLKVFCSMDPFS